jgi:transcription antitermination factor NusA-like protein
MVARLCDDCASGRYLCADCQRNYDKGLIGDYEVGMSRLFRQLYGEKTTVIKAVKTGGGIIVLVPNADVGMVIGNQGVNIKRIAGHFQCDVRILGDGGFHELARAIAAPADIERINDVMLPGGGVKHRVHIAGIHRGRLRYGREVFEEILASVQDSGVEVVFD